MTYRLGIDVGPTRTTWAVIAGAPHHDADTGAIDSVVTLVHPDDVIMAREFVALLGQPEPLIIGGTPYGVETLVGKLIAGVVGSATQRQGEAPAAVVVVHADGLDPYRAGLYTEALRLAGVSAAGAFVATRAEALAATDTADPAVGGAAIGWQRVPTPVDDDHGVGGAVALGGGAAGAVTIATVAGEGLEGGAAFSALAGPAGIGLAQAGPAGAPLGTSGPTGTVLPESGAATGAPLAGPPAPPGTPIVDPAAPPTPMAGPPAPTDLPPPSPSEATVRAGELEPAPIHWWRHWWFVPLVFSVVLLIAVKMVFLMGRSGGSSVAPATTVAARPAPSTTNLPPASVLAPASSEAVSTTAATTSTTTSTPTTTAAVTPTTAPPTTTPRTTMPRSTVQATVPPPTAPPTAPPTTIAPTTTINVAPVIGSMSSSKASLGFGCFAESATISATITDDTGLSSVSIAWQYQSDTPKVFVTGSFQLSGSGASGVYAGTFTPTNFPAVSSAAVTMRLTAIDALGLQSQIVQQPVTVTYCIG